jgi:hypothetical protein
MKDPTGPYSSAAFENAWRAVFSIETREVAGRARTV